MTVLVTGAAGFIGPHVAGTLLDRGQQVVGLDDLNAYYDPALKRARVEKLHERGPAFTFHRADAADPTAVNAIVDANPEITGIVHLAAQAGVRYSLENPPGVRERQHKLATDVDGGGPPVNTVRAFRVRLVVQRLWRQHQAAVLGGRSGRPARLRLRREQAVGRTDGADVRAPLPHADDRAAFLHRLRAVGASGHGRLPFH